MGLARLWTTGLVAGASEGVGGFTATPSEFVAESVPEFVPEVATASAANAAEAREPARSDARPGRADSPPHAARRTRQVAVESGAYRKSGERKVRSLLRRGSPVEPVGGKTR